VTDAPDPHDSPVFARARNLDPRVSAGGSSWTLVLGGIGIIVLAVLVFSALQVGRQAKQREAQRQAVNVAPAPVPSAAPSAAAPAAPPVLPPPGSFGGTRPALTGVTPPVTPAATVVDPNARRKAPAMVVDYSASLAGAAASSGPGGASAAGAAADKLNDNERFSERIAGESVESTRASRLSDLSRVAPQGTVIPAVLETAINSDTPGFARAMVTRDVRGFDGARVLIPRGSKLVGQYKSGVADGQSRAFVVWSRILTPEGVSIDVDSPAADPQGRGGLTGEVDSHFFRRFGAAILLSVISGGVDALASSAGNGNTAIVVGSPTQATQLASVALQKQIDIPVTIKVPQGEPIRVFVARDLDFTGVEPARPR
jgi:type IV secretion system protein VirB10